MNNKQIQQDVKVYWSRLKHEIKSHEQVHTPVWTVAKDVRAIRKFNGVTPQKSHY